MGLLDYHQRAKPPIGMRGEVEFNCATFHNQDINRGII